jgi:glycosyltransferase involved in cell wall biosynthesis
MAVGAKNVGNDVAVCAGGTGLLTEKLATSGVRVYSISTLHRDIAIFDEWKSFLKLLEILNTEKPDVLHSHSSKAGGLGAVAGRINNIGRWFRHEKKMLIVFTGHGWAFNEIRNELQKFLITLSHWLTLVLSHVDIIVSKKTAYDVSSLPLLKEKLHIIYNGIPDEILFDKDIAREKIGIPAEMQSNDTLIVGMAAEFHVSKGHYYALKGLAQYLKTNNKNIVFVLCGIGEEESEMKELCEDLNISENVFFAGFVPGLARMFKAFDILILPSLTEAFPYVILEAGYAGIPVIASSVGGIPEVVSDMESGILIQSRKAGEIARSLQFYAENEDKRHEFAKALHSRVLSDFSQDNMVKQTIELYEQELLLLKK